jgi:hypothetical protein
MEIQAFETLVLPFIIVFYLGVLLFVHPTRRAVLASLLGGLLMALLNGAFDLAAYYAHWWHYTLNGLVLHLPIPFYITPWLIYGSLGYLLTWRFWIRKRRLALLFLVGIPIFGILRDLLGWLTNSSYTIPETPLAWPIDAVAWLIMFYAGYWLFTRLATPREEEIAQDSDTAEVQERHENPV